MKPGNFCWRHGWGNKHLVLATVLTAIIGGRIAAANDTIAADRLVQKSLQAELAGDSAQRTTLLREAIEMAPEFSPARWHSGQVYVGGKWMPIEDAQAAAASDSVQAEYLKLREASGADSLTGQLALARWCRKNGLQEEADFHWRTVLTKQPNNESALRALGARWYQGRLMTPAEINAANERLRTSRTVAKKFAPQMARWERLLSAGDLNSRDAALGEIRALRATAAIPAMEEVTLGTKLVSNSKFERCHQVSLAFIAALDEMRGSAATNSLLRHAAFSPLESVRELAITALKKRPPHDYVPQLLAALSAPVESSFRVETDSSGSVHYFHSLYCEGPQADWSFEGRVSAMQHDLQGPTNVTIDDQIRGERMRERFGAANNPRVRAEMASVAQFNQQQFSSQANSAQRQIAAANRATAAANARVISVLRATTGEDLGDHPRAWWNWWLRYNEYSSDEERPVQEQRYADSTHRYYRPPSDYIVTVRPTPDPVARTPARQFPYMQSGRREVPYPRPPVPRRPIECFAAGTPVWTRTGLKPIEKLQMGDFILAQNIATGEMAYKPLIGRTVRPPSKTLWISLDKEKLQTTLGHPLWVAGLGWQMAKELDDDAILHGVNGPVRVGTIATGEEAEVYNLVVADFSTYFVGKSGILVHDNTPRQPTAAIVPGLASTLKD